MAAENISHIFGVRPLQDVPNKFVSVNYPEKMGNSAEIAYGGCTLSASVHAGMAIVPKQFLLYSALGFYLGPSLITEKLMFDVTRIRDTKTFQTVRVEARQVQKGVERTTFYITLDFQLLEPAVLKYNLPARIQHPPPEQCMGFQESLRERVKDGTLDPKVLKAWEINFGLFRRFFEQRPCPESIAGQNVLGMDKTAKTSQGHLKIYEKSTAVWFRSRSKLSQEESYAALAFVMDAALAFVPATLRNEFLDDYGAISSLDCAMRWHSSDFSCNDWLLQEQVTEAANNGRTFSTGRVFRQDGTLIATMHQMSIMRPKPVKKAPKISAPRTDTAKI